jgi:perosamine synthetase
MNDFIPVNEPLLSGNEKKYLNECVDTGWISSEGPFVKRFEEAFSTRMGRQYGVAVSNGTAALDVAVEALKIGPGDEVILPTFTIISCVLQIVRSGATPVLVDCDPTTWNMDTSQIEDKITARTKAIMVVHIFGLPVDMDPVLDIAQRHGLFIIEDAAEMIGQTYKGKYCGGFGDISTFSFYPNKHITTGEGGMVLLDSDELVEESRSLRNLCFQADKRFVHEQLGWNFRMTNMQAALGVAQLECLDQSVQIKRKIGESYTRLLANTSGIQLPLDKPEYAQNIYWVYGVVLDDDVPFDAKEAMNRLKEHKIGSRPFFWPMHEQPVLQKMGLFKNERYPVAENIARRGFYIPSGMALNGEQIERSAEALKEVLK